MAAALSVAALVMTPRVVRAAEPAWGVGVRAGTFGIPDVVVDQFLAEHPPIEGTVYGAELRYYGAGGPAGSGSIAVTVDVGAASADGRWRREEDDTATTAAGEVSMVAVTVTGYWDLFPSLVVHPFIGFGLGYARMEGSYDEDGEDEVRVETDLPVIHIPLGLSLRLGRHLTLRAEARVVDAFSFGGHLMINF